MINTNKKYSRRKTRATGRTGDFHNRKPPVPPVTKTPSNRHRLRVDDMPELHSLVINVVIVTTQQSPVAPRAASKPALGATSDYKAVTPTDWCLIYKSDISYNNAVQIWHEHVGPGHDLMKDLNSYNDCAAFIFIGSMFQTCVP